MPHLLRPWHHLETVRAGNAVFMNIRHHRLYSVYSFHYQTDATPSTPYTEASTLHPSGTLPQIHRGGRHSPSEWYVSIRAGGGGRLVEAPRGCGGLQIELQPRPTRANRKRENVTLQRTPELGNPAPSA